ncbi:DUF3073 domain-containing protein [Nocardioides mesophilus]|uniref:DUF3073 domain-containing protein n=1 Tax=Nocardioides mesophilus TaxID=433659 RepID=A0A7G9RH16_9ACTN|nr:DUF3073 domain-containing protein [Nocardioides mesophilus]QNN54891.1 DUF3073 domain-containing protein [Nocardioides mesophilus]
MGRGRAKAKQTKVARDLKYRSHETDLSALARELHGENDSPSDGVTVEDDDEWSDYGQPRPARD